MAEPPACPGPAQLGRGIVVPAGRGVPPPWQGSERVRVEEAALADSGEIADALHAAWATRTPVVVELDVPGDRLRAPQSELRPPWMLDPSFELPLERLAFLMEANNYVSVRTDEPVWWPGRVAGRLGASIGGPADVVLPDGRAVWLDGGPRGTAVFTGDAARHEIVHRYRLDEGALEPDRPAAVSADLAADQLDAVAHTGGPARVVAPAGSGKTRVLTARFELLVRDRGYGPAAVCALAYNVRAREEMARRLTTLPKAARRKVRTLHSIGFEILRAASRGDLTVVDERDVRSRLEHLVKVPHRLNQDPYAPYLEALAAVRLGLRAPKAVEDARDDVEGFAAAFDRYRDGLARDGAVDHDEQIYGAIEVLLREPELRRRFRAGCRHLLVDEFQDLTPAYLLLIRLLAAPAYDVFGVGDDDQVIYGYAGADPAFLLDYERYFPGAATHVLEVNYRCPTPIVEAAGNLLAHNRRRIAKAVRPAKLDTGRGLRIETASASLLARRATEIVRGWLDGGAAPDDIAVLARTNAALLPVLVLLKVGGVAVDAVLGEAVLRRTGMQAAFAWLRLAVAFVDGTKAAGRDLVIAARRPPRRLGRELLQRLERRSWTLDTLWALAATSSASFGTFVDDITTLGGLLDGGAATDAVLSALRDRIGLGSTLQALDSSGKGPDASHLDDLNALVALGAAQPDPRAFEAWLVEWLRAPKQDGPAVTLSSVHRVKGMEWPRVVVFGAHDGLMPHRLADDLEEERRVCHVAVTRAREEAVLLADEQAGTRFVEEMRAPPSAMPDVPGVAAEAVDERAAAPGPPRLVAAVGLLIDVDGLAGEIVEVSSGGVLMKLASGSKLRVREGEWVTHDGKRLLLAAADTAGVAAPAGSADPVLVDALKAWRRETARSQSVPAYVVLHDSHIEEIAARRPGTLADLGRCKGIGPAKLERYGDGILAVLAEVPPR